MLIVTTAGVRTDTTGKDSIAYSLWQYGLRVAAGEVDDPTLYLAWWAAKDDAPLDDEDADRAANPGLGDILDPAELRSASAKARSGGASESEYRIKRRNTWVASSVAALPSGALEGKRTTRVLTATEPVVAFFDGSFNHDCTAIALASVEAKPHIAVAECWERPGDDPNWRVPIAEVDARVRALCRDRNVIELACDPFRWAQLMEQWAADGLPVVEYPTSSPSRMVPAWAKWYDAVIGDGVTTDGDPRLERHARNTVLKTDRLGPRPVKEHRGSPRSIDLHICAIGAYDRATARAATPALVTEFIAL